MFRIFRGVLTILAVLGLSVGISHAFFSDNVVIAGNSFTGAEFNVEVRGAGANGVTLQDMAPGVWSAPVEYDVYNLIDSLSAKYHFTSGMTSGDADFYNKLNVRVRHTFAGTPDPGSWPVIYDGPMSSLSVLSNDPALTIVGGGKLDPNITHVFYFEFQVDPSADNSFQSKSAEVNFILNATQWENPVNP